MTYFDTYSSRTPDDRPTTTHHGEPQTPLQAAIATILDQAAGMAGGGDPDHRAHDLNAMESDIRTYCERMALYGTSPIEYINAVGADKIAGRRSAYRFDQPAGLRIAHDDDLRREQKEGLRQAIFGDQYEPPREKRPQARSSHGGAWANAQQHLMPGYEQPGHRYQ